MRISGFTFVRNAVRLDYPVVESIQSALPLVDEFVVNVGHSDDGTVDLIRGIGSDKVRIVESHWNPNVTTGGYVLAQQTNVALFNCTGTWAIYLQADELIHERDHDVLLDMMRRYADDDRIEGLLLRRLSFYGDYKTVSATPRVRHDLACRVVKPHRFVLSRGDAADFTVHPKFKERGRRPRVIDTGLDFFHYADVRSKTQSDEFVGEKSTIWDMAICGAPSVQQTHPRRFIGTFRGTHPSPMRHRVASHRSPIDHDGPGWRMTLTPRERRLMLAVRLETWCAPLLGISRNRIMVSHRGDGSRQQPVEYVS